MCATLVDPVCLAAPGGTVGRCSDTWATLNYSNPKLKPEKSRQFSAGAVFEPCTLAVHAGEEAAQGRCQHHAGRGQRPEL